MRILIVGAGHLGAQSAHLFAATGHRVTLIDRDAGRLDQLGGDTAPYRLVRGDACEPTLLEHSGVRATDLLVTTGGEDEDNLVIALLAKRRFGVPRVLARVNDPDNAWLFDAGWGVDVALPAAGSLVSLVEEAAGLADTIGLVQLAAAGITVIETRISATSAASGRPVKDITLPSGTVIATVVHDGHPFVPDAGYAFQPGDTVLIVTHTASEYDIHAAFQ